MTHFLAALAEITLTMSAVILLLLLLGPLLSRRYKLRWRYWAWLAVAVRLLIPINFSLPQAPVRLAAPPAGTVVYTAPGPQSGFAPVQPGVNVQSPAADPAAPLQPGADDGKSQLPTAPSAGHQGAVSARTLTLEQILFALWLAGAAGIILWHLLSDLRFRRYVRRWAEEVTQPRFLAVLEEQRHSLGVRARVKLMVCPGVAGPMLAGLVRPAILLPDASADLADLPFILRHELCHCRRRDIPYKALLLLAAAAHWFNPLVWLMVRQGGRDMELCCDDQVVARLDREERGRYGQIILSSLRRGRAPSNSLTANLKP